MIDNSMFYMNFDAGNDLQKEFITKLKTISFDNMTPIYLLRKPIIDKKADYKYSDAIVLLMPKHRILFFDFGANKEEFDEYMDDFIEDIGYIAKKYDFINIVGRPRQWRKDFVKIVEYTDEVSIKDIIDNNLISNTGLSRISDILISLATGSINEAERLGQGIPDNILDQIKRKIILFDGEQTKFIFDEPKKKRITIQGLAGTGKTELLLHKIKELYTDNESSKIVLTCHNEILADSLKKRVPDFFNFMKVDEQIQWESRLWVMRSWGSFGNENSGVYSYICHHYNIPFSTFSDTRTFDVVCKDALRALNSIENFECCFDYILIDESQDFSEDFFALCEKVTKKCVYVAGDIFQDIFEDKSLSVVNPDFLLNKCYRTDPRTLMGAHAIGMGLFERKLRWLNDDEWEACGYDIKRQGGYFELHRKPLMRFEDIDTRESDGITIIPSEKNQYLKTVLETIDSIKAKNTTVMPDDIGIIFMENINANFKLASMLQSLIKEKYDWTVNIGYETKEKKKGTLFVSNKNNVKGLEFPFVICIMQNVLTNDFSTRNSIYMMLTRSFLTSYLIMPAVAQNTINLNQGISFVNRNGYLQVKEPSETERASLSNAIIKSTNLHKSLYDMSEEIMDELGIENLANRKKIHELSKTMFIKEVERNLLKEFIQTNLVMMEQ